MMRLKFLVSIVLMALVATNGFAFTNSYGNRVVRSKSNLNMNGKCLAQSFAAGLMAITLLAPSPSLAVGIEYKLPPIDRADKNRCVLVSSSMGQANAGRDKLFDLRECDLKGQSGAGKDMSGMIGANADFSGVSFKEAQISKAFARNSKFVGSDFTNAVVDRVAFEGSDLSQAIMKNTVLSGSTFENANLKDTDFTDSYMGAFDLKNLCANPSLSGKNPTTGADTRESAGCLD